MIALEALRSDQTNEAFKSAFEQHKADLGFGLLLKKYVVDVRQATTEMMDKVAADTIPRIAPMFWSFRLMVALGMGFLLLFTWAFWASARNRVENNHWLLKTSLFFLPAP